MLADASGQGLVIRHQIPSISERGAQMVKRVIMKDCKDATVH
jgi:hypothetical protein